MEKIIGDTYLVKTRGKHKNKRGVYDHLTAKGWMSLKFNNGSEEAYEPDSLIHCKGIKQNKQKNNKKITMAKTKEPTKEAKLKEASAAAVDDDDDTNILAKAFQETLQLALERQYKMIMEDVRATIQNEHNEKQKEIFVLQTEMTKLRAKLQKEIGELQSQVEALQQMMYYDEDAE